MRGRASAHEKLVRLVPIYSVPEPVNSFIVWCFRQDRESFLRQLEDTENWLYEDGECEVKQVYTDRLAALKVCIAVYCAAITSHMLALLFAYFCQQSFVVHQ